MTKICTKCHFDKDLGEFWTGRAQCKDCMSKANVQWRQAHPEKVQQYNSESYERHAEERRTTSLRWYHEHAEAARARNAQWYREHPEIKRAYNQRRRALPLMNGPVESFLDVEIFDRDGWVCQLCEMPIDSELKFPDPSSVSLDHVVPLSGGGCHVRENVQAAHLKCNVAKGARV